MQRYAFILKLPNHFCISPLNDVLPTLRPLDRFVAVLLVVSRIFIIFAAGKGKITNNIKTMKRVLFILMLMTIGLSAQAAEELKIGSVTVNLNQDTEGGLIGLAGFYYYYHEEKTLKIYNGIMTNGGIESSVKDLTIEFYGNNILIYINLKADTHLTNQGTVTINPSTSYAMFTSNAQVDITGGTWVFKACVYLSDKKLIIKDGADVSITHTDASEYGISGIIILISFRTKTNTDK